MSDELLTAHEAQEYLGVSKRKMWRLLQDGVLATQNDPLDARVKLIKRSDLDALKAQSKKVAA